MNWSQLPDFRANTIRHYTYSSSGGAGKVAQKLVEIQKTMGLDASLVCDNSGGVKSDLLSHPVRSSQALVDFFLVRKTLDSPLFSLYRSGSSDSISKDLITKNVLFHLHWTPGVVSIADLQMLVKQSSPTIWTLHDMWPLTGGCHHALDCEFLQYGCRSCPQVKKPFQSRVTDHATAKREILMAHGAFTFVAPSSWMLNQLRKSWIANQCEIEVIPNPVDIGKFQDHNKLEIRKKYGLPAHSLIVGLIAVNLADPIKNVKEAVEIVARVNAESEETVLLVLVGGGGKLFAKETFTVDIGLVDDQDELAKVISMLDIVLSTSQIETFPTTILEAGASGIPCMVYPNGGMKDLITDGQNGFIVENKDEAVLKIKNLLNNREEIYRTGHNAFEKVERDFSPEVIFEKYLNVYQQVTERSLAMRKRS